MSLFPPPRFDGDVKRWTDLLRRWLQDPQLPFLTSTPTKGQQGQIAYDRVNNRVEHFSDQWLPISIPAYAFADLPSNPPNFYRVIITDRVNSGMVNGLDAYWDGTNWRSMLGVIVT